MINLQNMNIDDLIKIKPDKLDINNVDKWIKYIWYKIEMNKNDDEIEKLKIYQNKLLNIFNEIIYSDIYYEKPSNILEYFIIWFSILFMINWFYIIWLLFLVIGIIRYRTDSKRLHLLKIESDIKNINWLMDI